MNIAGKFDTERTPDEPEPIRSVILTTERAYVDTLSVVDILADPDQR